MSKVCPIGPMNPLNIEDLDNIRLPERFGAQSVRGFRMMKGTTSSQDVVGPEVLLSKYGKSVCMTRSIGDR